jgi:phosphoserine phosphatase
MKFALILVSSPTQKLSTAHLAHVQSLLVDLAVPETDAPPKWLGEHRAAEIILFDKLNTDQLATLRAYTDSQKIDIFCVSNINRAKPLLLADMDSTIVSDETLDNIAAKAGIGEQVAKITARAMNGEIDFLEALNARVAMLKGQNVSLLAEVLHETTLSAGAEVLIRTMAKHGATCVLVSGGFTFFTEHIARKCGFAYNHGNILDIKDDIIQGSVTPPILDKHAKVEFLNHYLDKLKVKAFDTIAVGDGANDLSLLQAVGTGVGYYPKPALEQVLQHNIKYSDLTALLYIQGYTDSEFLR